MLAAKYSTLKQLVRLRLSSSNLIDMSVSERRTAAVLSVTIVPAFARFCTILLKFAIAQLDGESRDLTFRILLQILIRQASQAAVFDHFLVME